ncbi:MAG: 30S ribosomal protein S5 [Candidatus Ryanbacteria bacterium RIFCSPLOWO2_01_FULL_48_26]|uniref:Small ribosomal subunit protein uS5 n=1 Tax=Candidatus Ryanbacteria bacterium RIFCSPLOWO2_01_FULL_48_26 TaxID=1802126 RepID=A0A1G2GVM6_9BACT|nr:MAG: 30S ribosomal protein S5 [Candidatus Ryanbacteria bacterium RIFCSPLOWO2_01_FULL_48_26]
MAREPRRRREEGDMEHKLIDLRRVARVVAGGRRFTFRATVVAGNRAGKVGIGVAKGADTALAIEKAFRQAKKGVITISLTKTKSIPYEVEVTYGSSHLLLKPAREGRGLVAGGAVRTVLAFAGIENASAKILSRSTNKLNNAKVTIEALKKLKQNHATPYTQPNA